MLRFSEALAAYRAGLVPGFVWFYLADDGRVYATAAQAVVSETDTAYLAWVEAGGIATPWPRDGAGAQTEAAVAEAVAFYGLGVAAVADISSVQAKIQLRRAGLRAAVEAALAQADGEIQDWYSDARTWQYDNPHVVAIGQQLGITDVQRADLFRAAALIEA